MFEIIWSQTAQKELNKSLIYWEERNKWDASSQKIFDGVNHIQDLLLKNSDSGFLINYKPICKIQKLNFFSLIYQVEGMKVKIIAFWDNRINPENLNIK